MLLAQEISNNFQQIITSSALILLHLPLLGFSQTSWCFLINSCYSFVANAMDFQPGDGFNSHRARQVTHSNKNFSRNGWLVGWGLTALLTQNRSYRAGKFVGIFHRNKL